MATDLTGYKQEWVPTRTTAYTVNLTGVPTTGWIFCAISQAVPSATGTEFAIPGWTTILAPLSVATRHQMIFAKELTAGMTSFSITWPTTTTAARIMTAWGTGPGPSSWQIGAAELRASFGASPRTWSRCPAVTATVRSLAVAVTFEASNALESPATILNSDNSMTERAWTPQVTLNDDLCTIWVGTKTVEAAASTAITTVNYRTTQDTNGAGIHFLIPNPVEDPRGPGFPIYKGNKAPAKLYRVTGSVSRQNYSPNPNPVDTRGWLSNGPAEYPATYDATGGRRAGTGAKKFTRGVTNLNVVIGSGYGVGLVDWLGPATRIQVVPGEVWTLSCYVKASVAFRTGLDLDFFNAAGAYIAPTRSSARIDAAAGTWVRPYQTVTVPAGAVTMGITNLYIYTAVGAGNVVGGEQAWIADCLIEKGSTLGDYFAGGYSPDSALTPSWSGTANASTSNLAGAILRTPLDVAMVNTGYGSYANMMSGELREVQRNLAMNPNLDTNMVGWDTNNGTLYPAVRDTATPIRGTASLKTTRSATTLDVNVSSIYCNGGAAAGLNQFPVTPGAVVTCSVDVKPEMADRKSRVTIGWRTAANAANGSSVDPTFPPLTAGQATRISWTATAPAGTAFAYFTVGVYTNAGNATSGERVWYDNLRASFDGTTNYFDGGYSPYAYLVPAWTGTANASVSTLSKSEFWWAHRGGSASFPEHSMHAYTQSILRGYQALEISLNRTSDGVWFGLHDQNLDRTSKVTTGFTDANQMTWAQVQSYQNKIGPGADQPYMTWDELIDAYGSTHILICDPKHRFQDYQNEFLDKCLSDIGTDRCIVKGFYDMSALRTGAQSRGLKTWGYLYNTTIDGDASWATKSAGWDILGLNYDAAQSYWDQVLALGKPVVGHICPNEAAVTTARGKGAVGFQCSGTAVVNPFPVV